MWEPDPAWEPIPAGRGSLTLGTWRVDDDTGSWLVKRVAAPGPEAAALHRPDHPGYWRREVEVALAAPRLDGLVAPEVRTVEEDDEGWALWSRWVERQPVPDRRLAHALGRFAGSPLPQAPWLARRLLPARVAMAEGHLGWPTLARSPLGELSGHFWQHRGRLLARYDALAVFPAHGDVVPANLLAPSEDGVVVADWSTLGTAPAGADLGYFALSSTEGWDILLPAYGRGLSEAGLEVREDDVLRAARTMLTYTALSRAEWALSRVARGEGPLAAKMRHPAIAPYFRSLQRHLPDLEALLEA